MYAKFKPAKLHITKSDIYIDYYVQDPNTGSLKRKKIKLNHIPKNQIREYARRMIAEINTKLYQGWNPFLSQLVRFEFRKLFEIFIEQKKKELREHSIVIYRDFFFKFSEWLRINNINYVDEFDRRKAAEFLDALLSSGQWGNVRYNRALAFYKTFYNWLIEKEYTYINVFSKFRKLKEKEKQRQVIPDYWLDKIFPELERMDNWMLVYAYLTFYCFLRPKEITMLRVSDIDLDSNIITIPGNISKNRKTQSVTIPPKLRKLLEQKKFRELPNDVLICSVRLRPGEKQIDPRYIAKAWARMRVRLEMPKEYQFYSLKDTGIVKMIRAGIDPITVRDQARHYSLEVTNRYIQLAVSSASVEILKKINY